MFRTRKLRSAIVVLALGASLLGGWAGLQVHQLVGAHAAPAQHTLADGGGGTWPPPLLPSP